MVWLIWLWSRQWASHKITSFGADLWWNQLFSGLVLTIGVVLGVLIMTSTWDFAIYGLVLAWVSFGVLCQDYRRWLLLIAMGIVMVAVALITSSPWWLHFDSISQGVKLAYDHSPLWQLAVLWLPHLSFVALSLGFAVRKWQQLAKTPRGSHSIKLEQQSTLLLITALALSAVTLLILPELIFVKDIYPNHPRANTMFKLTFQAFILMGLVIAWGSGQIMALLNRSASTQKSVSKTWLVGLGLALGLGVFVVGVGIYPYFGYRDYYGAFKTHYGLDGLQWLKVQAPDDFEALNWLKQTTHGRPVVLEAVGESYTTYARVSTFTGLPTVLGWRVHEWLWRGGFEIPGQRTEEVRKIYETPNLPESKTLLAQYQVKYIFVGSLEREAYVNLDLKGLENLGPVVFRSHETEIIQVD
ncbi:MAG TPA: hypothetical protein DEP87_04505 [Candidatus Pacebacteria bacterium]|nr:hypothetical protein [Candidatus Paceibacterota bacterium]